MGFRKGSFAKVWDVDVKSDRNTVVRLSISRKNKETGTYEQDFSGFVSFIGTAVAQKAAQLKEGNVIILGDVDVSTYYDKENKKSYTNFKCFSFEYREDARPKDEESSEGDTSDNGYEGDTTLLEEELDAPPW